MVRVCLTLRLSHMRLKLSLFLCVCLSKRVYQRPCTLCSTDAVSLSVCLMCGSHCLCSSHCVYFAAWLVHCLCLRWDVEAEPLDGFANLDEQRDAVSREREHIQQQREAVRAARLKVELATTAAAEKIAQDEARLRAERQAALKYADREALAQQHARLKAEREAAEAARVAKRRPIAASRSSLGLMQKLHESRLKKDREKQRVDSLLSDSGLAAQYGVDGVDEMFDEMDVNGDGVIDRGEFQRAARGGR